MLVVYSASSILNRELSQVADLCVYFKWYITELLTGTEQAFILWHGQLPSRITYIPHCGLHYNTISSYFAAADCGIQAQNDTDSTHPTDIVWKKKCQHLVQYLYSKDWNKPNINC